MSTRKTFIVATLVMAVSLLVPLAAQATSYTWTGTTSNAWSLGANWGGTAPSTTSDQATINIATHNPVSITATQSVGGTGIGPSGNYALFIDSTAGTTALDIGATTGILQALGGIYNNKIITVEGTLRNQTTSSTGSHPFAIDGPGSITLAGGTITSNNTHGGWTLNQAINGYGTINGSSPNSLTSTITANNATAMALSGTLNLAGGTLASTGSGTFTNSGSVLGYGTISAPFTTSGNIAANVTNQTLHVTGNLTLNSARGVGGSSGVLTSGAKLSIEGGTITGGNGGNGIDNYNRTDLRGNFDGVELYNDGQYSGATPGDWNYFNLTGNSTWNNGTLQIMKFNGWNLDVTGSVTNMAANGTGVTVNTGTLNNPGAGTTTFTNGNYITLIGGSITSTGNGNFSMGSNIRGFGTISAPMTLTGNGSMTAGNGTVAGSGTLTITAPFSSSGSGVGAYGTYATDILDIKNTSFTTSGSSMTTGASGYVYLDGASLIATGSGLNLNASSGTGAIVVTNDSSMNGLFNSTAQLVINAGKTLTLTAPTGTTNLNSSGSITGGNVTVGNSSTLTSSGVLQIDALSGGGTLAVTGGTAALNQKGTAWPTNSAAVHNIGMLTVSGGGTLDVTNNMINVNYGAATSPYSALAPQVNSGVIKQSTVTPYRAVGIYDTALNLDSTTPGGTTVRLGYASPGDTMMRGKVDSSDIFNILSAGKYLAGPSNARWDQGDFNHDGQVDPSDIFAILAAGTYNTGVNYNAQNISPMTVIGGPPSSSLATLIYNPGNGDVKIDPNGNTMTGFKLTDSAASFFVASAAFPPGGAFTNDTVQQKFWSTFTPGSYLTSLVDLGDIAPTGLTDAQFQADLNNLPTDSQWTKAGGGAFDYNFVSTPEPSTTVMLLGALGIGLVWWKRRAKA